MQFARTAILTAAAAAAIIAPMVAGTDNAEAKRRGASSYYYEKTFHTAGPSRGFEGFLSEGPANTYCSYRREPNRQCYITRSGRERCKVVSWKLTQHCY